MKKFLLASALGVFALGSIFAADAPSTLYMIGDMEGYGWDPTKGLEMTSVQDGVFTFNDVTFSGGDKYFAFTTELGSWDVLNAGRISPEQGNTPFEIGGNNPFVIGHDTSWKIEGGQVYTFTVDWNNQTASAVVTGEVEKEPMVTPETLYILGAIKDHNWTPGNGIEADSAEDGVFTFTGIELVDDVSYFSFVSIENSDWDVVNNYRYGPSSNGTEFETNKQNSFGLNGDSNWTLEAGTYNFTVNFNTETVYITPQQPIVLYVRGAMNGWGTEDQMIQDATNSNIFTYSFDNVDEDKASIKIADADWGVLNFGGSSVEVYSDVPGVQTLVYNDSDLEISNWVGGPMELTFNLETLELTIVGPEQPAFFQDTEPDTMALYVRGSMNGWGTEDEMIQDATNSNIYTFSFDYVEADQAEFKLASEDWSTYNYGFNDGNLNVYSDQPSNTQLEIGGNNLIISNWIGGPMELTFNMETLELTIVGPNQPEYDGTEEPVNANYTVFALDKTGWDAIALYMWGDKEAMGGWPGKTPNGWVMIGEDKYLTFNVELPEGAQEKLIFNNNGGGTQLEDFEYTFTSNLYVEVTASGVTKLEGIEYVPETPETVELYVRGTMNGWEAIDQMIQDPENTNIYTFEFENVEEGDVQFKIADSEWGDYNYGGEAMNVYSNKPGVQTLVFNWGNVEISNWVGGPMEITFNLSTKELTVVGNDQPEYSEPIEPGPTPMVAPEKLYIVGTVLGNTWNIENSDMFTSVEDGIFEIYSVTLEAAENGVMGYFALTNMTSSSWDEINAGTHRYGPEVNDQEALVSPFSNDFNYTTYAAWSINPGCYDITVDFNTGVMIISEVNSDGIASIIDLLSGNEAIYTLQGVKVNSNNVRKGQIYIIDGKKVMVK